MSKRTRVLVSASSLVGLILLGTLVYHQMEHWTWITSFYFSVITLTTVGYGDVYPTTDPARLFTAFYVLVGVGVVLASLGVLGSSYLEHRVENVMKFRQKKKPDEPEEYVSLRYAEKRK
ncbi:MAG: potassium channel family protein [Nanoarchaeota archaeon]